MPLQAQRLREQAEALFQKHRERGGHAAQRDQRLPREERDALFELKKEGSRLWDTANDLVKLASEQVLLQSQVRDTDCDARSCVLVPPLEAMKSLACPSLLASKRYCAARCIVIQRLYCGTARAWASCWSANGFMRVLIIQATQRSPSTVTLHIVPQPDTTPEPAVVLPLE